jgi:hypothetical protein
MESSALFMLGKHSTLPLIYTSTLQPSGFILFYFVIFLAALGFDCFVLEG